MSKVIGLRTLHNRFQCKSVSLCCVCWVLDFIHEPWPARWHNCLIGGGDRDRDRNSTIGIQDALQEEIVHWSFFCWHLYTVDPIEVT